jgi:hypothetical protein
LRRDSTRELRVDGTSQRQQQEERRLLKQHGDSLQSSSGAMPIYVFCCAEDPSEVRYSVYCSTEQVVGIVEGVRMSGTNTKIFASLKDRIRHVDVSHSNCEQEKSHMRPSTVEG